MKIEKSEHQSPKNKFKADFKKRLYKFTLELVKSIDAMKKTTSSLEISKQIIRSGTSILANYVEARAASSDKDFVRFFTYSLKSANETIFWLELLRDLKNFDEKEAQLLIDECQEVANVLGASIITLKNRINSK